MTVSVKVTKTVHKCRECPNVDNTDRRHACAFTSAPHPCVWNCSLSDGPGYLRDVSVVDPKCPLLTQPEVYVFGDPESLIQIQGKFWRNISMTVTPIRNGVLMHDEAITTQL